MGLISGGAQFLEFNSGFVASIVKSTINHGSLEWDGVCPNLFSVMSGRKPPSISSIGFQSKLGEFRELSEVGLAAENQIQ